MKIRYEPSFYKLYKKANVRIRNKFDNQLRIFKNNPFDPILKNHELKREWEGYRSINITADYRAIYKEIKLDEETVSYFIAIGTHEELYALIKK